MAYYSVKKEDAVIMERRASVKISESDENKNKLYYKYDNEGCIVSFHWLVQTYKSLTWNAAKSSGKFNPTIRRGRH